MTKAQQEKALRLLRDARGAIVDELGAMGEEEREQPIPKKHGKVVDQIDAFLKTIRH